MLFAHLSHNLISSTIPALFYLEALMFSQSLTAQLIRMVLLLALTLVSVHHCQPLLDSLAEHAMNGGCHQQNSNDHTLTGL
ncbi:hypothetical protein H744_2c1536 [Photobacterium gaetbulicola Gung47]|uniref:Uncharacterized protein n=2 Tax=Photobacterium gaetbulicola TaxID=1295392 RepID=A0A0C5WT57_9GAMM|nr:hypothetical protein H744_2c1536 [Photobacterium gaetbulicola Gung47]